MEYLIGKYRDQLYSFKQLILVLIILSLFDYLKKYNVSRIGQAVIVIINECFDYSNHHRIRQHFLSEHSKCISS